MHIEHSFFCIFLFFSDPVGRNKSDWLSSSMAGREKCAASLLLYTLGCDHFAAFRPINRPDIFLYSIWLYWQFYLVLLSFFISAVIVSDGTVLCTSKFENVQLLLVCMFCMSDILLCIYYGNKPCFLFELSSQLLLVFFLLKLEQAFDQVY